jgi:hypothetical protein
MTIQCTECGAYLEGVLLGQLYRCECGMYYTVQPSLTLSNNTASANYLPGMRRESCPANKRTPVPRAFYAAFGDER